MDQSMRKLRVVMMAFVAVFAFSAVAAATASAETTLLAEWLIEGVSVEILTATEALGKFLFEDKNTAGAPAIECEVTFDGSVGPNGEDEITTVLTEGGVAITLSAPLMLTNGCKLVKACEEAGGYEIAPDALPWHTFLYLTEAGSFRDHVIEVAYVVTCRVLFVKETDECKSVESSYEVLASAGGAEAIGVVSPGWNCTLGGASAGTVEFKGENHLRHEGVPVIPSSEP